MLVFLQQKPIENSKFQCLIEFQMCFKDACGWCNALNFATKTNENNQCVNVHAISIFIEHTNWVGALFEFCNKNQLKNNKFDIATSTDIIFSNTIKFMQIFKNTVFHLVFVANIKTIQ